MLNIRGNPEEINMSIDIKKEPHSNCYQDLLPIPSEWQNVSYVNDICSSFYRKDIEMVLFIHPPLSVKPKEMREDDGLFRFMLVPTTHDGCEYEWNKAIYFNEDISSIEIGEPPSLLWKK
tara:strand:+ start:322 stop:681 length:360 start_codon:yes stop_codon:yes gene_type:complete